MPSKSKAQQRLMGQAWAIRKGELERNSSNKAAQEIADSDMTDKELRAFAETSHKSLPERVKEALGNDCRDILSTLEESLYNDNINLLESEKSSSNSTTKLSSSRFNTFTNYKYANRYKPQYQEPMIQSKTVIVLPNYLNYIGHIINAFEDKDFELVKVDTKRLLPTEASKVLATKKDKKWYKETRDNLFSGPSTALLFNYNGEDIEKDFKSACERLRRVLKLKALHEAFVFGINDFPYFAGIDTL